MSRIKTTVFLAAGCIFAGTALWWLGKPEFLPSARSEKRSTVLNARLDEITEINICDKDETELKFIFGDDGWQMTEPSQHPADSVSISRLLDVIERAPLVDCISAKECRLRDITESVLGFDHPSGRVTLFGPRKFKTGIRITIGDYTATSNEVFATVGSRAFPNDVYVTTREIADIVNNPEVSFIDPRLFRNDPRRVNTIIINRGDAGTIKLIRDKSRGWLITQPVQARADWDVIDGLFGILYSAKITDLKQNVSVTESGCRDSNAIRMQIFGQDIPAGLSVTLGNPVSNIADVVYAQIGDDYSPAIITGAVARLKSMTLQDFRDKRIFTANCGINMDRLSFEYGGRNLSFQKAQNGTWTLTGPVAASASPEIVAKLISNVLTLTATGIADVPQGNDSVQSDSPKTDDTASRPLTISFHENGLVYNLKIIEQPLSDSVVTQKIYKAVLNKQNIVYELQESPEIEFMLKCLNMPHIAVDKKILDINEKDISRLEITRGEGASEVIEQVRGKWKTSGSAGQVFPAVVSHFFKTVHPLIADSVISANPSSGNSDQTTAEASDKNCVTLTFNFSDGISLQKTLILGPALPDSQNKFYARIKAYDVIYAISAETMFSLTQSIISQVTPDGDIPSAQPPRPAEAGISSNE